MLAEFFAWVTDIVARGEPDEVEGQALGAVTPGICLGRILAASDLDHGEGGDGPARGHPCQMHGHAPVGARVAAAGGADGAVLITGGGHARTDRGVPMHLAWMAPGRTVAALAMIEVAGGENTAETYARRYGAKRLPFDFVWFTARHDVGDPCEKFREQMQKLRKKS